MNEAMKQAWLEISQMLGEPTREELDVFLRTWQRATEAQKKAQQEPVGDIGWGGSVSWHKAIPEFGTNLYTSPQPAQQEAQAEETVKERTPQERRDAGEGHCPKCFYVWASADDDDIDPPDALDCRRAILTRGQA